jgi:hypothetical protein
VWPSILGLFCSLLALLCFVWLFFQLSDKLSKRDLESKLASSSLELSKKYALSVKEIEAEWDKMYLKFASLAGRMDRNKYLDARPVVAGDPQPEKIQTRSDILRGKNK